MLRRFDVHLIDDAAWIGGLMLLVVLLLAERRLPARAAVAANLVLVAGVALLMTLATWALDQGLWSPGLFARLSSFACFAVAFSPLAVVLAAGSGESATERTLSVSVVLVALLVGSILATAFRTGDSGLAWGAASLSLLASVSWTVRRANRPKCL